MSSPSPILKKGICADASSLWIECYLNANAEMKGEFVDERQEPSLNKH